VERPARFLSPLTGGVSAEGFISDFLGAVREE